MLVSLTMASVNGGGSAGGCGWLLTGAGVGLGVGLGTAGPVRRRGVWATANVAHAISVIEMIKSLVRFMASVFPIRRLVGLSTCAVAFDKLTDRRKRINLVNRLVRPQAYDARKAQRVASLVAI